MKKLYPLENAINFLRKGIAVSLLILLSVTTHSNSIDKNTARKTAYGFLLEKPSVPLPNSKREDVYSYAENTTLSSKAETVALAGRSDNEAPLPPPPEADSYEPNNTPETATVFTAIFDNNHTSTIDILNVNSHINTDVDFYKINLADGYFYSFSGALYDSYNQIDNSSYTLAVIISYSPDGSSWNRVYGRQLPVIIVPGGILYLKIEPVFLNVDWRVGTYAARIEIKKATTVGCSYTLSASSQAVTSAAGTRQVNVTTGESCLWTATSNAGWITLTSGQSATGSGTVGYSYSANTEWGTRTATIIMAGRTYTLTQLPPPLTPDSYEVNNTLEQARLLPATFTQNKSTISISAANCHHVADVDFYKINLEAGYRYTINATLYDKLKQTNGSSYTLDAKSYYSTDGGSNWGYGGDAQLPFLTVQGSEALYLKIVPYHEGRMGTYAARIEIDRVAHCTYSFVPKSQEATPVAGTGRITVTASLSCASSSSWTATTNVSWITLISGHSGTTGSGVVDYSYNANTGRVARTGTITIAEQTFTVTQTIPSLQPDSYERTSGNDTPQQAYSFTPVFTQNASTISISPANCHNPYDVDHYKLNLESGYFYTVSLALRDERNDGNNYTLAVQAYYSRDGSGWSADFDDGFTTRTVPGGDFYIKIARWRGGQVGTYAATINISITSGCSAYTLSVASKQAGAPQGTGKVDLTTGSLCGWTAASHVDWITLTSGQSGTTGSGSVDYSYPENIVTESRTGTITVAGQTYTVTQAAAPVCTFMLSPNTADVTAAAGTGSVSVRALRSNCAWTNATSNANWITLTSGQSGTTGNGSVGYSYQENIVTSPRTGTITVAGQTYTVTQAGVPVCTFTLSPNTKNVTAAAGTGNVSVTALRSNCAWTNATSNAGWITLTSGQSGTTGNGSVGYSYQENIVTSPRTGTMTVAGQTYTVTQAGVPACTFTLSPNTKNVTAAAGTGNVSVTALRSICAWTNATSNAGWITLTSGQSGTTGNGSVGYSYTENKTTSSRTGTITVANQTYTVTQAAASSCPFTLDSNAENVTKAAGTGTVSVTATGSNCAWTATSNVPWITLTSGQSGTTGSGSVGYSYTENKTASSRTGTITVANQTFTVTQAAASSCPFTLDSNVANVSAAAGTGSISVTATGSNCAWTAISNAEWITLTSGQSGTTGSGSVGYSYTENKTASSRTGTITVANQTFTLTQSLVTGIEPAGHVKIFPNPAGDFVTVDLSAGHVKYVSLKITNQFGQILYEWNSPIQTLQIPLKGFANGLYFIQIQGEEKVWVEKLVIKH